MILVSATAFGTNAILAKLAYREGLGTSQTLAFRFVLAFADVVLPTLIPRPLTP